MPPRNTPSPGTSKGDVEQPLPCPGEVSTESKPADPLATVGEVFSFMPNIKTKVYFCVGIFFASLSGCVLPAMAFLFSSSFEDLSGSTSKLKSKMAKNETYGYYSKLLSELFSHPTQAKAHILQRFESWLIHL